VHILIAIGGKLGNDKECCMQTDRKEEINKMEATLSFVIIAAAVNTYLTYLPRHDFLALA
jgi:hypothetical protein